MTYWTKVAPYTRYRGAESAASDQWSAEQMTALRAAFNVAVSAWVDMAIAHGMPARELADSVRDSYLDGLKAAIESDGRVASASRLAILSGLNKFEVQHAFRESAERAQLLDHEASLQLAMAAVLAEWHNNPKYSMPYGAPMDLILEAPEGTRSFAGLAGATAPDHEWRKLLTSLRRVNAVELHEGYARCLERTFIPRGFTPSALIQCATIVSAHLRTILSNFARSKDEPALFERHAQTSERVNEQFVALAQNTLRPLAAELIGRTDAWMESHQSAYVEKESGHRYGVGVYLYEVESGPAISSVPALEDASAG